MNISPRILKHEIQTVLGDLERQDAIIRETAEKMNTQPWPVGSE